MAVSELVETAAPKSAPKSAAGKLHRQLGTFG